MICTESWTRQRFCISPLQISFWFCVNAKYICDGCNSMIIEVQFLGVSPKICNMCFQKREMWEKVVWLVLASRDQTSLPLKGISGRCSEGKMLQINQLTPKITISSPCPWFCKASYQTKWKVGNTYYSEWEVIGGLRRVWESGEQVAEDWDQRGRRSNHRHQPVTPGTATCYATRTKYNFFFFFLGPFARKFAQKNIFGLDPNLTLWL